MIIYDISDVNQTFKQMIQDKSGEVRNSIEIEQFGKLFWAQLNDDNRKLYHWVFPPRNLACSTGIDYEGRILARQERAGWYD